MVLATIIFLHQYWSGADKRDYPVPTNTTILIDPMTLIYVFLGEHLTVYLFGIFREHDLKHNGTSNKYGIETAPKEFCLKIFEVVFDVLLFVVVIYNFTRQTDKEFHEQPLLNYWLLIDIIIMLITLPYTIMSQIMMMSGEITKNVFTLYQVQKRKLKERREKSEKDKEDWKLYFEQEEAKKDAEDKGQEGGKLKRLKS
jgi:hypothetical protein